MVVSKTTGVESKSQNEIEEEENKMLKEELASDAKAAAEERKELGLEVDSAAGIESVGGSTFKSETSGGGAANAIEEASRKMKLIALKAYQTKVIKSRLERTDYSANLFNELNMISLD